MQVSFILENKKKEFNNLDGGQLQFIIQLLNGSNGLSKEYTYGQFFTLHFHMIFLFNQMVV